MGEVLEDWQLFGRFAQRLHTVSATYLEDIGVPRGQAAALLIVRANQGITQSGLGAELAIQGATVTTMLQRMEEKGLVDRRRDPDDNRLVRVYLTPLGERKARDFLDRIDGLHRMILAGFSDDEQTYMRGLFERVVANMERTA